MELEGKVAIVTGASLGIGSACALDLAKNGADVAINYRKHDTEANAICDQIKAMGRRGLAVRADVSSFGDAQAMVDKVVKEFGRIDILVNNAGVNRDAVIWKMTEQQWDEALDINLKGYFNYIAIHGRTGLRHINKVMQFKMTGCFYVRQQGAGKRTRPGGGDLAA